MTPEEIHEAIKQVQAQTMSLHQCNLEMVAGMATTDTPEWVVRFEWWGAVLMGALIGAAISLTLVQ